MLPAINEVTATAGPAVGDTTHGTTAGPAVDSKDGGAGALVPQWHRQTAINQVTATAGPAVGDATHGTTGPAVGGKDGGARAASSTHQLVSLD